MTSVVCSELSQIGLKCVRFRFYCFVLVAVVYCCGVVGRVMSWVLPTVAIISAVLICSPPPHNMLAFTNSHCCYVPRPVLFHIHARVDTSKFWSGLFITIINTVLSVPWAHLLLGISNWFHKYIGQHFQFIAKPFLWKKKIILTESCVEVLWMLPKYIYCFQRVMVAWWRWKTNTFSHFSLKT